MRDITDCVSCKSCGKCLTLLSRNAVYVNYIGDIHANGRVGADMGKPVSVDKIAYKPRNDDNDVTPGIHTNCAISRTVASARLVFSVPQAAR